VKIAVFDYRVVQTNPAGSCHRALIAALSKEHDFTVFSNQFDNPAPDRVRWVRVPAIRRPLAALFVTFHLTAMLRYFQVWCQRRTFGFVQSVESNFGFGDVVYSHFCHKWFLKRHWKSCRTPGVRGFFRWADHVFHAALEPWVFHRARWIVVPSTGLARELTHEYPYTASKLQVISNPVDLRSFHRPPEHDPAGIRTRFGIRPNDTMLLFTALGHFERKGLPQLLEGLALTRNPLVKLVVVGGSHELIRPFKQKCYDLGLGTSVHFVGHQENVRPYLWAADLFVMPSFYEVFPLTVLQAAAASCPIMVTRLNGVEEFLDAKSAVLVEPSAESISAGLQQFLQLSGQQKADLVSSARHSVSSYGLDQFVDSWRSFYRTLEDAHQAS